MKEAIVCKGPVVKIINSEIPKPGPKQVVIKVIVSGSNPKDWKLPFWFDIQANQGDDIAGIIHEVGDEVFNFKIGDRVTAFHEMSTPGGSYAEYAVAWDHTTIHIPESITFEEAATIPLAALTAVLGLYERGGLNLPPPWTPATEETPVVIYGGASAVGAFAIQLAQKSNIHPIIAVAGKGGALVEKLIDRSKGDTIIDYRLGDEAVVAGIKSALNGRKLHLAYDAVSEKSTLHNLSEILEPEGKLGIVLGGLHDKEVPAHVKKYSINVGHVHKEQYKDFGHVHFQNIARGLAEGWFKPHPHEVIPGGLGGVEQGLTNLRDGKASAVKYVFRIEDTSPLIACDDVFGSSLRETKMPSSLLSVSTD